MKKIVIETKVITPTLMGGGFGQNDGIRPSEIKGAMRYWFRAVAGSIIGNDIEALKYLESQIFGSQERKSSFRMVVKPLENFSEENLDWWNLKYGVKYLGFSINMNKERLNNVIKAGSEFTVEFLFKNNTNEKIIKLVTYSFYLATALGGFGLRSRRGFGSWQIIKANDEKFENLKHYEKECINININIAKSLTKNLCNKLGIRVCETFKKI